MTALWYCCIQAIYCYSGTEIIGLTASEAETPRETIPKAVRRVSYRIFYYFAFATFILGLNVSANDPQLAWFLSNDNPTYQGPWVLMAQRYGIPGLPHFINGITILAVLSAANANLFETVLFIVPITMLTP
jgi:yeast amino acid transporter